MSCYWRFGRLSNPLTGSHSPAVIPRERARFFAVYGLSAWPPTPPGASLGSRASSAASAPSPRSVTRHQAQGIVHTVCDCRVKRQDVQRHCSFSNAAAISSTGLECHHDRAPMAKLLLRHQRRLQAFQDFRAPSPHRRHGPKSPRPAMRHPSRRSTTGVLLPSSRVPTLLPLPRAIVSWGRPTFTSSTLPGVPHHQEIRGKTHVSPNAMAVLLCLHAHVSPC